MNTSKLEIAIVTVAVVACAIFAFGYGVVAGKDKANEEWKQRTREAGFNLVKRYDQITGEARLVLIPTGVAGPNEQAKKETK
jgi:hypothetical protein